MAYSQTPDKTEVYDFNDEQYLVVEFYLDLGYDTANYHYQYKNDNSIGDSSSTDIEEIQALTTGLKIHKILTHEWFNEK